MMVSGSNRIYNSFRCSRLLCVSSRENLSGEMDGPDDKAGWRTDAFTECGQTP